MNDKMTINILHLYPDLLNLYGDKGNIATLKNRLKWRGIDANVTACNSKEDNADIENADIIFLGGGSDREQEVVLGLLKEKKQQLVQYIEDGGVMLAVCGGYELLGKYCKKADAETEYLGILDIYTEEKENRLIGNVVTESELFGQRIIGFENHGGRTYIGDNKPLGKVVCGYGNNGETGCEGVIYKNLIGTYLHGPILPKNPMLCDYILTCALKKKYADFTALEPLNDQMEDTANQYMEKRIIAENGK